MKIPEGYDEVINQVVGKEDCLIFAEGNIWIGSSSKTILEESCGQDAGRRFSAQ